jgi:CRP-like cAMP-binding protein
MILVNNKEIKPIDRMNPMWNSLTQEERMYLRENTTLQIFKKNNMIYCSGDEPKYLICMISGMAKIYRDEIGMTHQQIVRLAKTGDVFAYRAFLAKEAYCNSAVALETSQAYLVPLKVFEQIVQSNSRLAMILVQILAKKLGTADARLATLTQKYIRGRMAQTIISLKDDFGTEPITNYLHTKLSRNDLAYLSNMTPSNAIRTLSNFVSENLIEVIRRNIKILNEEKLRNIAKMGG